MAVSHADANWNEAVGALGVQQSDLVIGHTGNEG